MVEPTEVVRAFARRLDGVPDDTSDIAYLGVEMTHGEGRSVRDAIDAILAPTPADGTGWQAEAERQEQLAKIYRRAQLTAEQKLCREEANARGWQHRAELLERQLATLEKGHEGEPTAVMRITFVGGRICEAAFDNKPPAIANLAADAG